MSRCTLLPLAFLLACAPTDPEVAAWEAQAEAVTIIRDD